MDTLTCPLSEAARSHPHKVALITEELSWTYAQLNALVCGTMRSLQKQGVKSGDKVAFLARTNPQALLLFWALFRLQAVACPLHPKTPPEQILMLLQRLGARLLSFDALSLDPLSSSSSETLSLSAHATFLFTSGSTALPKIACHSLSNHYYSALGSIGALQLEDTSRLLLSLPLYHVGGLSLLFRACMTASTLVLSSRPLAEALPLYGISHLSLVPTQLYRLLSCSPHPPPSLRCVPIGGAPLSDSLRHTAKTYGWPLRPTYGLTETSSMVTLGSLLPFRELKLEKQEIFVKGPVLFQGYWDETNRRLLRPEHEGWFATKDLGRFNATGELEILGRKDRQFISGGENIQPEEIERALCSLPGILAAHVVPLEDPEFGQRPAAFIATTTHSYTLSDLHHALKPLLPTFKHPIQVYPFSPPEEGKFRPTVPAQINS